MKKFLSRKNGIALLSILAIGVFFLVPHKASAGAIDAIATLGEFLTGGTNVIYGFFGKTLYWVLLWPLNQILGMAGGVLDIVVRFSLNSKELYESEGVNVGWTAFRDICNMIFIFVLIVASIKTIFQSKIPKDTIKNVILAAITINFSLYVTKFILDIANIFAVWLYNAILGLAGGASGLGSTLIGVMNISAFFGRNGANPELINDASAFIAVLVISIITIMVIIMVVKSTFLFLSRTIAFVFHMIMSPLGLMSKFGLIPESFAKEYDWWDSVKKDALMPVVFFLLLYISLYFTSSIQGNFVKEAAKVKADGTEWLKSDVMKGNSFKFSDFILFFLIYMLFDQCYKISKKYTSTIANQIEGYVKGAAGLAAGVVGVGAIGSLGKMAASSGTLQKASIGSGFSGIASRMALSAADKAQSSGFGISGAMKNLKMGDAPLVGETAKAFAKDSEKGLKGINEGTKKRFEKNQEEFAKMLGKGARGDALRLQYAENLKKGGFGSGGIVTPAGLIGLSKYSKLTQESNASAADKIADAVNKDFDKNAQKEVDKAVKKKMDEKQKETGKSYTEERDEIETAKVTHEATIAAVKRENQERVKEQKTTIDELKKAEEEARQKIEEELKRLKEEKEGLEKASGQPELDEATFIAKAIKDALGKTEDEHVAEELKKLGFDDEKKLVGGIQPQDYTAAKEKKITDIKAAYTTKVVQKTAEAKAAYATQAQAFTTHKVALEKTEKAIEEKEVELEAEKVIFKQKIDTLADQVTAMELGIAVGELANYKQLTQEMAELAKYEERLKKIGTTPKDGEDPTTTKERKELLEKQAPLLEKRDNELGKKWQRMQARKTGKIISRDGKDVEEEIPGLTIKEAERSEEIYKAEREAQETETEKLNDTAGFRTVASTDPVTGKIKYSYTKDAYSGYKDLFGRVKIKTEKKNKENREKADAARAKEADADEQPKKEPAAEEAKK